MRPKVSIYGTIPMQINFLCKMGPNRSKQSQTEPKGSKQDQTGSNSEKQIPAGPNSAKQGQTGHTLTKWGSPGLTGADLSHLEPTGPCNGFHMSLHMIEEKLKHMRRFPEPQHFFAAE